jgi:hypothetical protein
VRPQGRADQASVGFTHFRMLVPRLDRHVSSLGTSTAERYPSAAASAGPPPFLYMRCSRLTAGYHPTNCFSKIAGWGWQLKHKAERPTSALASDLPALHAFVVSPVGLRIATGRLDFSLRVEVLSLTFVAFLLIWSGALVCNGRARRAFFYLIACRRRAKVYTAEVRRAP